jgi:hypothetical protein
MKLILIVGLLALAGCVGNKTTIGQANNTDNKQCDAVRSLPEHAQIALKLPHYAYMKDGVECECSEIINCGNAEHYCIAFACTDGYVDRLVSADGTLLNLDGSTMVINEQ